MVKPVPAIATEEIVRVALPVFFKVTVIGLLLVFTVTFPKATGDGEALTTGAGAATPVPFRESVAGEPAALLVIIMLPEAAAAVVGLKLAVNVVV
jgi:hypothetical protein